MPAEDTNAASSEEAASQALITPPSPIPAELRAMASREREKPFGPRHIWYTVYVPGEGWVFPARDGQSANGDDPHSRIEAVEVMVVGTPWFWLRAHMESHGWQDWVQAAEGEFIEVGAPGKSLRLEALSVAVADGEICADARVQTMDGWQGWRCSRDGPNGIVTVGTTGHSLRMEALRLTVGA